jgi:hypothetical protein
MVDLPPILYNRLLKQMSSRRVKKLIELYSSGLSPVEALRVKKKSKIKVVDSSSYSKSSCYLNPKTLFVLDTKSFLVKKEHILACKNLELYNSDFLTKEFKNKNDLNSQSTTLVVENLDLVKTIIEKKVDALHFYKFLMEFESNDIPEEIKELFIEVLTYVDAIRKNNMKKNLKIKKKQSFFKAPRIITINILPKEYESLNVKNFETTYYLAFNNYILELQSLFQKPVCDESVMVEALDILYEISQLILNIGNEILEPLIEEISTLEKTHYLNELWINQYLKRERLANRNIKKLQNFAAILNICKKIEL